MANVMAAMMLAMVMMIARCKISNAADADPILDYCVADNSNNYYLNGLPCKKPAAVTSSDFKTAALAKAGNTSNALGLAAALATGSNPGGLNTQGLSIARIDLAKGGIVPPHVHPRASEVLYVVEGSQLVGFIDTSNRLFSSVVNAGELFVFPRGLVHYQINVDDCPAFSLSSLNSQNPGLSFVASSLFGSIPGVPDLVLQKTFSLSAADVEKIKKAFQP